MSVSVLTSQESQDITKERGWLSQKHSTLSISIGKSTGLRGIPTLHR